MMRKFMLMSIFLCFFSVASVYSQKNDNSALVQNLIDSLNTQINEHVFFNKFSISSENQFLYLYWHSHPFGDGPNYTAWILRSSSEKCEILKVSSSSDEKFVILKKRERKQFIKLLEQLNHPIKPKFYFQQNPYSSKATVISHIEYSVENKKILTATSLGDIRYTNDIHLIDKYPHVSFKEIMIQLTSASY